MQDTESFREYKDATEAECLVMKQRKVQHVLVVVFCVLFLGLLASTKFYDLPYQEHLINGLGLGMLFAGFGFAILLVIFEGQSEKIDRHAGQVIYDEEYRHRVEACPVCGRKMTRQGFADTMLDGEMVYYDHTDSPMRECVYTHKRVGVYVCPNCGTIYGNSDDYSEGNRCKML